MKRTGFKKLSYKEAIARAKTMPRRAKIKRSKVKKPKLKSVSQLKKILWKLVSNFIRERDKYICFTSGVKVSGSNAHCGHMYPSSVSGILLRYHPHNLACQSYVENIHHSGNGAVFYQKALEKYGHEKMNTLKQLKQASAQGDRHFYTTMIDLYKQGNEENIVKFLEAYL